MSTEQKKKTVLCLSSDVVVHMLQWCTEVDITQLVRTCKQLHPLKDNARVITQIVLERHEDIFMRQATISQCMDHAYSIIFTPLAWQDRALQEMLRVIHARMPPAERRVHFMGGAGLNSGKTVALLLLIKAHISALCFDFPNFIIFSGAKRDSKAMHSRFYSLVQELHDVKINKSQPECLEFECCGGKISVWLYTQSMLVDHVWPKNSVVLIDDLWGMERDALARLPSLLQQCRAVISTSRPAPPDIPFICPWRIFRPPR